VEVAVEGIQVVPREPAGEKPTGQAGPAKEWKLRFFVVCTGCSALRTADGDAPRPRLLDLVRQAEVRAAAGERDKSIGFGVGVCFSDSFVRPIRAAECAYPSRLDVLV